VVTENVPDLILNKREIQTTVTVDDGQIIALGGLIDENERRSIERVPILGDIPVLGELFKSRSRNRTKTNLMVFIRPTIVRSAEDAQKIAGERYAYVRDAQARQAGSELTALDELVRDYLRTAPPALPLPPEPPTEAPKP
jgi:general secretion pathway protein D